MTVHCTRQDMYGKVLQWTPQSELKKLKNANSLSILPMERGESFQRAT